MKKILFEKTFFFINISYIFFIMLSHIIYKKNGDIINARFLFLSAFNFLILALSGNFMINFLKKEKNKK